MYFIFLISKFEKMVYFGGSDSFCQFLFYKKTTNDTHIEILLLQPLLLLLIIMMIIIIIIMTMMMMMIRYIKTNS